MTQLQISSLFRVAEVELVYKKPDYLIGSDQILCSADAYQLLKQSWDENRIDLVEQFKILLLDHRHRCLALSEISTGGMASCIVDPKIVFATALKAKASKLILAHNHPSGNLAASEADLTMTKRLIQGGKILDIEVLEHIIMASNGYYSMADNGLIP